MTIKLYTWPMSSGVRVHWALEELGVPFERIVLDRGKNENRAPEYLAIHPGGKVPAIVDGDDKVFESPAILVYLGEKYGVEKGLWPKSGPDRAAALSWTVWAIADLQNYLMQYAYNGLDSPVSYKAADRSKAAADFNHGQLVRMLDCLEARLADRDYVLGASFTLADLAIASVLGFGKMLGVDLGARPLGQLLGVQRRLPLDRLGLHLRRLDEPLLLLLGVRQRRRPHRPPGQEADDQHGEDQRDRRGEPDHRGPPPAAGRSSRASVTTTSTGTSPSPAGQRGTTWKS